MAHKSRSAAPAQRRKGLRNEAPQNEAFHTYSRRVLDDAARGLQCRAQVCAPQRTNRAGRRIQRIERLEASATQRSVIARELVGDFRRSTVERSGERTHSIEPGLEN